MDKQLEDIKTEYWQTIIALREEEKQFNEEFEKLRVAMKALFESNEKNTDMLKAKEVELRHKFYEVRNKLGIDYAWLLDEQL